MSTLQISLAVGGSLVLVGIVAHGAWSARKNLPKQATPKPAPDTEPAAAPGQENYLQLDDGDGLPERHEPSFDTDAGLAALTQLTTPERKPVLDILIDAIAPVTLASPVAGEAALAAMPSTRRVGSKPFAIEGLRDDSREWEIPAAGHRYSAFQCGVQLANRTGALNAIEYSEFVMKTQAFADAIGGEVEFAEMQGEVARARELDQFAGAHDAQLSFKLRAVKTAWSPGYVQQCAAGQGFIPSSTPGRMLLPASQAGHGPILGLSFDSQAAQAEDPEQTALYEVALSLDVPQVLRSERPFARMCEVAIALAGSMDGVIIDDNAILVRPEAMEAIHADLEELYDRMDARELSAGSALGRRLFS
ncbi:cell division protein ZipA C-terminal FtsZ-binding domain-containing protein [Polaromonas sp.]|uniref:cell division protein ZipA C-terminal FtsZ-binding domain-containing protein n=1 Tax=Polaromonas sp. TaxID=1869339 RepID=UPI0013BD2540|nr:cell division protein ZipA C-terminal FtsZ-binding domain-containing protein [Polaromonas sp.]NDP61643.1 cell division protein FtsZ [Polaromonas sp.]